METYQSVKEKYSGLSENSLLEIIAKLTGEISTLRIMLFSTKRERFQPDPDGQPALFDEVEKIISEPDADAEENEKDETEVSAHRRARGKRKPLPADLPRFRHEIDLPESEKICPLHGMPLEKIGEEVIEKLDIVPAKVFVEEQVIFKYKCPCCEGNITEASRNLDPIPKSFAAPGLLAYIATAKYTDGLPLYRLERIFQRYGIDLSRTTMARWMLAMGELIQPLINLMHEDLLTSPVIHGDETRVQVLDEPGRSAQSQSYMWTLARRGDDPIVLFKYYENRSKRSAHDLLNSFKGILICDGYKVYQQIGLVLAFVVAGCMAHVRRKFWHAEKIAKKEAKKTSSIRASEAMSFIRKLYAIEKKIKDKPPDEILAIRQLESVPIMNKFHAWLIEMEAIMLPSSPTGKAVKYALGQWEKLNQFTNNGLIAIDNNFMESHIRPFVVGRKAWMFAATPKGAHASSAIYSLVETAKANGVDPYDYLRLIFKELPMAKTIEDFEKLLPYRAKHRFALNKFQTSL